MSDEVETAEGRERGRERMTDRGREGKGREMRREQEKREATEERERGTTVNKTVFKSPVV